MRFCLIKRKIGEPVQVLVSHYFARAVVFFASEANYLLPVLNLENMEIFKHLKRNLTFLLYSENAWNWYILLVWLEFAYKMQAVFPRRLCYMFFCKPVPSTERKGTLPMI